MLDDCTQNQRKWVLIWCSKWALAYNCGVDCRRCLRKMWLNINFVDSFYNEKFICKKIFKILTAIYFYNKIKVAPNSGNFHITSTISMLA